GWRRGVPAAGHPAVAPQAHRGGGSGGSRGAGVGGDGVGAGRGRSRHPPLDRRVARRSADSAGGGQPGESAGGDRHALEARAPGGRREQRSRSGGRRRRRGLRRHPHGHPDARDGRVRGDGENPRPGAGPDAPDHRPHGPRAERGARALSRAGDEWVSREAVQGARPVRRRRRAGRGMAIWPERVTSLSAYAARRRPRSTICGRRRKAAGMPNLISVLVVDDDPVSSAQLGALAKAAGYEVRSAPNGREAWELLQLARVPIVISDWYMPEMDGPELCRRIRARTREPYVYFILVTSRGGKEQYLAGMDAGADDFIAKPA